MGRSLNTGEEIASGLSLQTAMDGLKRRDTTAVTLAMAYVKKPLHRILLGAKFGGWAKEQDQIHEIVLRHCWSRWLERRRQGNYSAELNDRVAYLALLEWQTEEKITDTYRAKLLGVGYKRFMDELRDHCADVVKWLHAETENALAEYRKQGKEHG